jgi:hypothetical protein
MIRTPSRWETADGLRRAGDRCNHAADRNLSRCLASDSRSGALAKAKTKAKSLQCLINQKQLMLAWTMYADDNHDKVPYAAIWPRDTNAPVWVQGQLDFNPLNRSNWSVDEDIKISPPVPVRFAIDRDLAVPRRPVRCD